MLEGLEAVEINFLDLTEEYNKLRMDAEFFKKKYVQYYNLIRDKNFLKIGDFSFVTDGIHESIDFDRSSKINLISAKSPKKNYFDLSANHHISLKQHLKNPRTQLRENDVIISTVGTIGNCAVVRKNILPANSDRHVGIVRINEKIKPSFLSTFLLTKYGRFQTLRESTGNVQLNLFIYKIKELLVPELSNSFQLYIENLCTLAYQNRINARKTYTQAEKLLLEEIGLQNFTPSKEPINIKTFKDSFETSGRLDAEYYQFKYEEIESKIINYKNGFTIIKKEFDQVSLKSKKNKTGFNYIEIGNVNVNDGSCYPKYVETKKLPANAKILVEKGDILISKVRPNRGAVSLINFEKENLIVSGAFTVLRENINSVFSNEVLKVLLRTKVYRELLLKFNVGTSYPVIKDTDVLNLPIPKISKETQEIITTNIKLTSKLKKMSEHLLKVAKKAVEIAIEESEDIAIEYINKETK